jgi:hypothetical protein
VLKQTVSGETRIQPKQVRGGNNPVREPLLIKAGSLVRLFVKKLKIVLDMQFTGMGQVINTENKPANLLKMTTLRRQTTK